MEEMFSALCVCKKDNIFRQRRLKPQWRGGGIHGEDALSKLSHTATVCVAGFFIDPNPNRLVGPNFFIACCLVRFAAFFSLDPVPKGGLN